MKAPDERTTTPSISRRQFLLASGAGAAVLATRSVLGGQGGPPGPAGAPVHGASLASARGPAAEVRSFDDGWLFGPSSAGSTDPGFDDSDLLTVTLPHDVAVLSWREWDPAVWEQEWVYRKHFDAPAEVQGMRVFLDFDAALTSSVVTLNGRQVGGRMGGYLPFSCEITGDLQPRDNVVAVTLDSRFNIDVPPDRPAPYQPASVDFWQPGGMYRGVTLRTVPAAYISDVFAKPTDVLDPASRRLVVDCTLDAATDIGACQVRVDLLDGARTVASTTVPATAPAGASTVTATLGGLEGITLWDADDPYLYRVVVTLLVDGRPLHDYQVRIGFRQATFTLNGFFLNGKRVKLFGLDRHQFFPFAGGAMPDRVQRRDVQILRQELNCNFVRCSHYPQSEAFYDACDELGLMVWEEIPGWGYFGDSAWQEAAQRDLQDMIIRDRNHPSVIVWGCMPNESGSHAAQYSAWNSLAHSLDDSRPTGGDDTGYNPAERAAFVFDVYSYHDYSFHRDADGKKVPDLRPPTDAAGKPYLVCEAVGTLSGPAIYYRRTDPQWVQQGEATAHARVQDISYSDDRYCGVAAWSGFDYESGSGNQFQGVKYTGVVDVFRQPKPGATVYQSQVDPNTRPVIAPAFYWDFGPTSPINELGPAMICSNLDRLEVYVAGQHHATVTPDRTDYGHLPYPPSFVDFTDVSGTGLPELRIDGYLGGRQVASRRFSSDPSADRLAVSADDDRLVGDGSDATRVVVRAVDRYGAPRPYVTGDVTFSVDGPGVLVGDNPFAFADAGGVGAVWLRTIPNSPGMVRVRASHPSLGHGDATIRVSEPAPGGPPAPYGALAVGAAPVVVTAGQNTTVSATFTNQGNPGLDRVALTFDAPPGWQASALTPTGFAGLPPGRSVTARWRVAVPPGTDPGSYPMTVKAVYSGAGQRGVGQGSTGLLVGFGSLAAAFDNAGISDDSNVDSADFDGVGNSFSAEALSAAGLSPGTELTHNGVSFTWPDVAAGRPDNVVAAGQAVLLSGTGSTLGFLGASSPNDEGGQGTVYYTDGTTSSFTVTLDNFFYPPDTAGNEVIAATPYLNSQGRGGRIRGQRQHTVYVYYAGVPLDPSKTVQAVVLPSGGSVPANGRVTGMHVFSMGVG
ncbi:MAG TPA: glycoside hydrolase family 2 TIM barrel-domain containing protein [Acidimicrobiales bacterium]|nr:glycoside hydrolase family 2 TIM barrel-domain containing protein [Acidimicrobiales bacterium]